MLRIVPLIIVLTLFASNDIDARSRRVLFLGNSYTSVNNLPQLLSDVALSAGDTIVFDSYLPGGYTLEGHSTDPNALLKIASGPWDVVVLQEQSQRPSFPINQVEQEVFPFARSLDSTIHAQWPCALTLFYMTWGRKNGDATNCAAWPPICTYEGMDSLLRLRYTMMADSNQAGISPVGAVWRQLRQNVPMLELYQSDGSHPSLAGSYAAACSFYTTIFRANPLNITTDAGLPTADAQIIRDAAKAVVFDSLSSWNIGRFDPVSLASPTITPPYTVSWLNQSQRAESYLWDFGDGITSTAIDPIHSYSDSGTYTVTLIASRCSLSDTFFIPVSTTNSIGIEELTEATSWKIYPNPFVDVLDLSCSRVFRSLQVKLLDVQGRILFSEYGASGTHYSLRCPGLASGFYRLILQELGGNEAVLNVIVSPR